MKIIIMSCKNKDSWYKDKLGSIYTVVDSVDIAYIVKDKKKGYGLVNKDDCEVIDKWII
jgi:ribosome-binding ATPase YchF (GTP1/OBG family)